MSRDADETQENFEAKAKAEGWKCSRCGKEISFDDREAYRESNRCTQCHYEMDTESGSIPTL